MLSNVIVNCIYNGKEIQIQSKRNETMKTIFQKCSFKIKNDLSNLCFLCNGNQIDQESNLEDINNIDNEINILVYDLNNEEDNKKREEDNKNKNIICPKCGECAVLNIQNYKINLSKCDNGHNVINLSLDEFNNSQKIYESELICKECNKNKGEVFEKKFFRCCTCKISLCPICKLKHDKNHLIIDFDLRNYKCNIHGEKFISFCKECSKNLCDNCELNHDRNHHILYPRDIYEEKEDNSNELFTKINILKSELKNMINKITKVLNNLEVYSNINEIIIKKNLTNKNYQILTNINNIKEYNQTVLRDINTILNSKNIGDKSKHIYELYSKMTNQNQINNFINNENNNNNINNNSNNNKVVKKNNEFKDDIKNGKIIKNYKNGDKYIGEMNNNMREGKGIYYFKNGNRYEGDWKKNLQHGKGIFYFKGGERFEGDWKNGKIEGKGVFYCDKYREMGDYVNGVKKGIHATLYNNGDIKSRIY